MNKNNLKFTIITIILGLTLSIPVFAMGKADLALSPGSGEHQIGKTFNVSIMANANEETVDTIRALASFPKDRLEVVDFSFGSLYSMPAGGNKYDNEAGTLSYGAGHPGGTSQSVVFGTITFKVKAIGKATVTISSDSQMIFMGEDKFTGKSSSASYILIAPPPPPPSPPPPVKEKEEPKEEEADEKESADIPFLKEETVADKEKEEIKEVDTEEKPEISEEEKKEKETSENKAEEKNKETSDKTWMIITIILSVFFGLAGYYYGRSKSRMIRRR